MLENSTAPFSPLERLTYEAESAILKEFSKEISREIPAWNANLTINFK